MYSSISEEGRSEPSLGEVGSHATMLHKAAMWLILDQSEISELHIICLSSSW